MSKPPCPMWIMMGESNWQILCANVSVQIVTRGNTIDNVNIANDTPIFYIHVPINRLNAQVTIAREAFDIIVFFLVAYPNLNKNLLSNTLLTPILKWNILRQSNVMLPSFACQKFVCMYVCMYVRTYVCTYACMHACIYLCVCVCR